MNVKLYETEDFEIPKTTIDYGIFVSGVVFIKTIFGGIVTIITTNFSSN